MTSYYSVATFLRFTAAVFLLFLLLQAHWPIGRNRRVLVYLFTLFSLSAVTAWVLVPVCPFPELRLFLNRIWVVFLVPSLLLFLSLQTVRRGDRDEQILEKYSTQIVDHTRESLVVFNSSLRVISSCRKEEFGSLFPVGSLFSELHGHLPGSLKLSLQQGGETSGECELSGRQVMFRILPLPKAAGFLLLLSDVTREMELIRALEEKEIQLKQRQRILNHLESGADDRGKRELRRSIACRVEALVEERLAGLTQALDQEASLSELLTSAELSMDAIRHVVSELSPERYRL